MDKDIELSDDSAASLEAVSTVRAPERTATPNLAMEAEKGDADPGYAWPEGKTAQSTTLLSQVKPAPRDAAVLSDVSRDHTSEAPKEMNQSEKELEETLGGTARGMAQPAMTTVPLPVQNVGELNDPFPPAARASGHSPVLPSVQEQQPEHHKQQVLTPSAVPTSVRSATLTNHSIPLPSSLIRSQVAEPLPEDLRDAALAQASEAHYARQPRVESVQPDQKSDHKGVQRPHSVDTIRQELEAAAPGFVPVAGHVRVVHPRGPAQTNDTSLTPTAIGSGVASDGKISHLVDPVRQELEDPTPDPVRTVGRGSSRVEVEDEDSAAAVSRGEPRTLLRPQLVDPVHQELEETTPGRTATAATGTPAAVGASKVAFEYTNHVSVTYNETGAGSPAEGMRRDLLVENGSRVSYATAFLHSVELDGDDEDEALTTREHAGGQVRLESNFPSPVTRQDQQGPSEAGYAMKAAPQPPSADNETKSEDLPISLQQQLHALKSDGVSTQPPVNTVKPTLDKDVAALKELRAGAAQHRTTVEPVSSDKYPAFPREERNRSSVLGHQRTPNTTSEDSKYPEEVAEGSDFIANPEAKQVKVPTSAVPPTTTKEKILGKDEDFKGKAKATVDSISRSKKLMTASTPSYSNLWTRILPLTTAKSVHLRKPEAEDGLGGSEEREEYEPVEEKLLDVTNDSHIHPVSVKVSPDSPETGINEEKEMIPVPISTVIPSTMINHRYERVDDMKTDTIVHSEIEPQEVSRTSLNNTVSPPAAVPLKINSSRCSSDDNCAEAQDAVDMGVLSTTVTTEAATTTVTPINTYVPSEATTEITEENWTTSPSLVDRTVVTDVAWTTPTDAFLDPTTLTTAQPEVVSSHITTVAAVTKATENSTGDTQDAHTETEPYSTTTVWLDYVKDEPDVILTEKAAEEQTTMVAQTTLPSTTRDYGSQWLYDQPQESSNDNGWQQDGTTTSKNVPLATATYVPETTTEQESDKDLSEWDVPDKAETVTAFCRLMLLASGEQVCQYLGGLPSNISQLLQQYTGRVIMSQQVVIHMLGNEVRCDDITRERTLDVYIQDENGSFDYDLSVMLKKIWDENHPPLPFQILSMELVKDGINGSGPGVPPDSDFEPDPNGEITPGLLAAIVVACIGTVSLLLLFGLMVYVRRRQKRFNYGQRCTPVSLDAYSVDSISVYDSVRSRRKGFFRSSKRSYGNLAFDDPNSPSHPMNFAGLANFSSDIAGLQEEFEAVPQVTVTTDELPEGADVKNRYSNVIPLPETRVQLTPKEGEPLSDYINANYVRGPNSEEKFYIASQAPLQSTITDFWRMVWEQQTKVILMICNLVENGSEKCADYLPPSEVLDCHRLFGDFQITLKKREEKEKYVISTLQIKNLESNLWREITHMWFANWPEQGVPDDPSPLIAFLIEARSHMRNAPGPHVVHCSPGTGRTGTVIACDILIREFEKTRNVDVPRCVYRLRRDRAGAVKTKEQYVFIYKVLNHYATMLTGGALDSI